MTEEKLILSSKELDAINTNTERIKGFEKDKQIIELKKQLITVQDQLLTAQKEVLKRDNIILEYHFIQASKNLEEMKSRSKEELEQISRNHKGLKDKSWGYNPETGEIIINEDTQTID